MKTDVFGGCGCSPDCDGRCRAGSGAESYRFYTIDKKTGQQIQFGDLYEADSGYNNLLSENIRDQMRAEMAADENKIYWVDEYEVAPDGYMGAPQFTVEKAVFESL